MTLNQLGTRLAMNLEVEPIPKSTEARKYIFYALLGDWVGNLANREWNRERNRERNRDLMIYKISRIVKL